MNLQELLMERAELTKEGRALLDKKAEKGLTEEEDKRYDEIKARRKQVNDLIEEAQEMEAWERQLDELPKVEPPPTQPAVEKKEAEGFDGPDAFGKMLQAVYAASIPNQRGFDPRLTWDGPTFRAAATGLSEGVASDGGFLVEKDVSSEIFRIVHQTDEVVSRVRRIPISAGSNGLKINAINESSRADGSRWGGVQAYWTAEAAEKTASDPEFRQMELDLKKLTALVYSTDELLQDAAALQTIVMQALQEEFAFKVGDAIFNGTGAGQMLGILNSGAKIAQAKETGQAAATIVYDNVLKMWSRLHARSRASAVWFIDQSIEPQLYKMSLAVGTGGAPVYLPAGGASSAPYASLFGRPVIPVEYCSALGTEGDICLFDLSQYLMIDKGGLEQATSMHVRFVYDETVFRFVLRVDGQPLWNTTLTPKSGGSTQSPFITLATRS